MGGQERPGDCSTNRTWSTGSQVRQRREEIVRAGRGGDQYLPYSRQDDVEPDLRKDTRWLVRHHHVRRHL
jgi:hypothetical protein